MEDFEDKTTPEPLADLGDVPDVTNSEEVEVEFTVEETPPWALCILLGFQHYISMFVATLSVPMLLAPAICMFEDNVGKSEITGTLFFASGIITLAQNIFGVRLPIVQAGTFALLAPTLAYFNLPQWKCPNIVTADAINQTMLEGNDSMIIMGSPEHKEIWMTRIREIQGSLMIAALFEAFLGLSGAVGLLLRYIGPLSICPTISLLGLSLFRSAAGFGAKQWWICLMTMVLMVIFSQYLGRVKIPLPFCTRKDGCQTSGYPIFKMFPVILAILVAWVLCFIFTATNVFPTDPTDWGYGARTDLRTQAIIASPWFRVPYPGQWGIPSVSVSCVCALLAGIIATTVESVGDYHACARLAGAPAPPVSAINRGIFIEGMGSFLDGILGTGNGTTSTSINVGVVGITKVGSRAVVMVSAVFMIVLGVLTKFGALFVTIPDPIIGGSFFILFGMIVAVGISNLQYVDLNSSRNLFIFGFSFFFGLSVPYWMTQNPDAIKTGSELVDNIFTVLLSTSMFVGGVVGFFLDNTIPGSLEERGMAHWRQMRQDHHTASAAQKARMRTVYDIPFISGILRNQKWASYIPICTSFDKKKKTHTKTKSVPKEHDENNCTV